MKNSPLDLRSFAELARDPVMRREAAACESPTIGRRRGQIPRYRALAVISMLSKTAPWGLTAKRRWRRERRLLAAEPPPKYSL